MRDDPRLDNICIWSTPKDSPPRVLMRILQTACMWERAQYACMVAELERTVHSHRTSSAHYWYSRMRECTALLYSHK